MKFKDHANQLATKKMARESSYSPSLRIGDPDVGFGASA
jgi:hypothetical protein